MKKSTQIILLSFIAVLIVLVLTLGITRAFFKPITDTSSITGVSLSSCAKISLTNTTDAINLSNTYPMSKNRALKTTPYSFTVSSTCDSNVGFNLYIATTTSSTLDASNIHYIVTAKGSKDILADGTITEDVTNTFTDAEKTEYNVGMQDNLSKIYKLYNASIPLKGTSSYDLYLYVDENVTDTSTQGKSFIAGVAVKAYDILPETLAEHIVGLYTTQGANNLYHHDGTLIDGANDNSYRYAGKYEEVNNWVCFGSNATTCPQSNLYRIIGVFDELNVSTGAKEKRVKLIMNDYAGESVLGKAQDRTVSPSSSFAGVSMPSESQPAYYWSGSSSNQSNNWGDSTINTETLNGTYLNILGSEWSNKIDTTEWKIGGNTWDNIGGVKAATAYQNEIINKVADGNGKKTANAKVGLMYASDYGFAASQANWTNTLGNYYNDTNIDNNWLFRGVWEWTISRDSDNSNYAFYVHGNGRVYNYGVYYAYSVRPVFYLESGVTYAGGTGSSSDPIRIN